MTEQEARAKIWAKVREKMGGRHAGCPLCRANDWSLEIPYLNLALWRSPSTGTLGHAPSYLPSVAMCCRNCGNTHALNLYRLGFTAAELETMVVPENTNG